MTPTEAAAIARAQTLGAVDAALNDAGYEAHELPRRVVRDLAGLSA